VTTPIPQDDERSRLLFTKGPLPMWVYDLDSLHLLDANEAAVARYGYSREEFRRMRVTDLRIPDERPNGHEGAGAAADGLPEAGTQRHQLKDGRVIHVKITAHPWRGAASKAALMVAQELEQWQRFFTLSLDLLCIARFDGYFIHLNPAWERTLGFTVEELKAKPFIDFIHPEDKEATIAEAARLMTGAETVSFQNRYQCKDGTYRWLLWSAAVSLDEQLYYSVARDITERKRTEEALVRAKDEAEQANRAKSLFLSRMSHDLRTPLNAIIGFSDLLMERVVGDLTEKQAEFLGDIRDSGLHLLTLINDILDLAKVESGRVELQFEDTDLMEVIHGALTMLRPLIQQKHLEISTVLGPSVTVVRADKVRLKQILYNLLSNAVKFTPDEGHIRVEGHQVNGELDLAVVDTGPGIAPDDQRKLFREFTQLAAGQLSRHAGTGLGLALVRHLVELHGGRVGVESEVGKGSRFTIRLPLREASQSSPVGRAPVLIVEDDPAIQRLLSHYLTQAGYRTEVTGDGSGLVAKVKALHPAVICLDVRLPGVEDWEILRRLKEDPATASIPIVVATVLDDAQQAFALGAASFLVKPIRREALLDAVGRAIRTLPGVAATVLIVDDDPHVHAMLAPMLTQAGYVTLTASGGREGIALAQKHLPHLIILDLLMPEVSGFDVISALRADVRTRGLAILVLTAKDLTPEERAFLAQRVQQVTVKGPAAAYALIGEIDRIRSASIVGHEGERLRGG